MRLVVSDKKSVLIIFIKVRRDCTIVGKSPAL